MTGDGFYAILHYRDITTKKKNEHLQMLIGTIIIHLKWLLITQVQITKKESQGSGVKSGKNCALYHTVISQSMPFSECTPNCYLFQNVSS